MGGRGEEAAVEVIPKAELGGGEGLIGLGDGFELGEVGGWVSCFLRDRGGRGARRRRGGGGERGGKGRRRRKQLE